MALRPKSSLNPRARRVKPAEIVEEGETSGSVSSGTTDQFSKHPTEKENSSQDLNLPTERETVKAKLGGQTARSVSFAEPDRPERRPLEDRATVPRPRPNHLDTEKEKLPVASPLAAAVLGSSAAPGARNGDHNEEDSSTTVAMKPEPEERSVGFKTPGQSRSRSVLGRTADDLGSVSTTSKYTPGKYKPSFLTPVPNNSTPRALREPPPANEVQSSRSEIETPSVYSTKAFQPPTSRADVDPFPTPTPTRSELQRTIDVPAVTPGPAATPTPSHFVQLQQFTNTNSFISVQGKRYLKLQEIGKGGSSRVYKVMDEQLNMFACKKVSLKNLDKSHVASYANEINMLQKLTQYKTIIRYVGHEVNEKTLLLVMELADLDLSKLLEQRKGKVQENYIRLWWMQMLEAVHTIHSERIFHGDLKPANFVVIQDTTAIEMDNPQGTLNYISPEVLAPHFGKPEVKVSRVSDVWSLGCILYQMVYGKTPFSEIRLGAVKMQAIINPQHEIAFPPHRNDLVVDVIKKCLVRNPKDRITIDELLRHPFVHPTGYIQTLTNHLQKLKKEHALLKAEHEQLLQEQKSDKSVL